MTSMVTAEAALGALIASQAQEQILKTTQVAFDSAGKIIGKFIEVGTELVIESMNHHARTYAKQYAGTELIVNEIATSVNGHTIRLTVVLSPEDKINGQTFESAGKTSAGARSSCESCIGAVVRWNYKA